MRDVASAQAVGALLSERALKKTRVSRWREWSMFANLLSLARIALTPLFVWWFLSSHWQLNLLGFVVFVVAAFTDWWDGHHARTHKSVTNLGKFLDPLADKLLTITAMITFVYRHLVLWWMVAVIFTRDLILTWVRIRAAKRGKKFTTLWLAKLKTTVQLIAIIAIILLWCLHTVALEFGVYADLVSRESLTFASNFLIGVTMILALVSGGQYFVRRAPADAHL